jgi:cephalosporin-C deacetylase-like acetyl esterase
MPEKGTTEKGFEVMKKMLLGCLAAALSVGALYAAPEITISPDRKMPVYQCGENAVFTVSVKNEGKPVEAGTFTVKMGVFGGQDLSVTPVDLSKGNPITVSGTLKEPGFILVTASGLSGAKNALAGAGFEPEKIELGNPLPEDFMKFWEDGRAAIAGDTVHLEKLDKYSTEAYTSYAVTVDVLHGEKLYGFLAVPAGNGPFPAYVQVPGAGAGQHEPFTKWAERKVIALNMNVHKYPVALGDAKETKRLYEENAAKIRYPLDQADNRDKYHFRNVILGVDRMVNYVAAMPQWDKKHFVFDGSSQGGGMALIMAGLNKNITAAAANVPAICDHGGKKFNRQPGWPNIASKGEAAVKVSAYFDAGNFAKSITCPVFTSTGFIDTTCAPSSVYAAYNQIKSPKMIFNMPTVGHTTVKEYSDRKNPWVEGQLGLGKVIPPTLQK